MARQHSSKRQADIDKRYREAVAQAVADAKAVGLATDVNQLRLKPEDLKTAAWQGENIYRDEQED